MRWLLLIALGCGGSSTEDAGLVALMDAAPTDAAPMDAAPTDAAPMDAAPMDAAPMDAAPTDAVGADIGGDAGPSDDAGPEDATLDTSELLTGFGTIAGPCGLLGAEALSGAPSFFVQRLDFGTDRYDDPAERPLLTAGAQEILMEGTSGGGSGISEAFAYEVLARCEGAVLHESETEIMYSPPTSAKTDLSANLGGVRLGVSVARAFIFPLGTPYTLAEADRVVGRKLRDILESTMNVVPEDGWHKQVLAVMTPSDADMTVVRDFWDGLADSVRADTIVYVIITDGADDAIY